MSRDSVLASQRGLASGNGGGAFLLPFTRPLKDMWMTWWKKAARWLRSQERRELRQAPRVKREWSGDNEDDIVSAWISTGTATSSDEFNARCARVEELIRRLNA
jgi:hypothetical protein